jgi:hypothetical protein
MNLTPLAPQDYFRLKPYFERQEHRLCSYSLVSILTWINQEYRPYGAFLDDTLIVCGEFNSRKQDRHMLLPISPTRKYTPEMLADLAEGFGFTAYWYVPEDYIRQYGHERVDSLFKLQEQKGFHDYIYLTEDLSSLGGNRYSKKRNLIHQFKNKYLESGKVAAEPITSADASECIDFIQRWCDERGCDMVIDESLACEKQAVLNTIANLDILEVSGILVRIDREICAFAMSSRLTGEMGTMHFEKALVKIKGLYQYIDNFCAKTLFSGYTYINKESDMNIPGLARAKKSYYPVEIVKSFRMDLR